MVITGASLDHQQSFAPFDYLLYAVTVSSWSASWYALSLQPGVVANEVSLLYRFVIAAGIMVVWAFATGKPMRFSWARHSAFAAMGVCIFSTNFLLFYYGSAYLVSGLLSVVFSLASLINMLLAAVLFGEKPSRKIVFAAGLGLTGIVFLFWPEIASRGFGSGVVVGLCFCMAGTLSFCIGSQISSRMQANRRKIPLVSTTAWGMVYGAVWCLILALVQGKAFNFDPRPEYALALLFLAIVSTVIAFAAYLTLVGRIGTGRAGYATVVFPVFALLISTALEGYEWTVWAFAGLALVGMGNVLVMRGR